MVSVAVTTVHTQARFRASRQLVSSTFATAACWTAAAASATTGASAALVACSRALTEPTARFTPNRSSRHCAASRLLRR